MKHSAFLAIFRDSAVAAVEKLEVNNPLSLATTTSFSHKHPHFKALANIPKTNQHSLVLHSSVITEIMFYEHGSQSA